LTTLLRHALRRFLGCCVLRYRHVLMLLIETVSDVLLLYPVVVGERRTMLQDVYGTEECYGAKEEEKGFGGDYSWLEEYLVRLEGKEARQEYYAYV
jgi:hypothetical protein